MFLFYSFLKHIVLVFLVVSCICFDYSKTFNSHAANSSVWICCSCEDFTHHAFIPLSSFWIWNMGQPKFNIERWREWVCVSSVSSREEDNSGGKHVLWVRDLNTETIRWRKCWSNSYIFRKTGNLKRKRFQGLHFMNVFDFFYFLLGLWWFFASHSFSCCVGSYTY